MRNRNMYYLTGLPGWMRFGYSPGWVGRSPTAMPPGAQYLMTGQWPTPQMQMAWQGMQAGQMPVGPMGYQAPVMGMPYQFPMAGDPQQAGQQQLQMLQQQAQMLQQQLEQINAEIQQLQQTGQ